MGTRIDSFLAEQVFVSCGIDDDIPYVKSKGGERSPHHRRDFPPSDALRQDQIGRPAAKLPDKLGVNAVTDLTLSCPQDHATMLLSLNGERHVSCSFFHSHG